MTMDQLWDRQAAYNSQVKAIKPNQDWLSIYVLGLLSECDELLNETQWKQHRKPTLSSRPVELVNVALELADITKYVISLWQQFGFSVNDMLHYTTTKSAIVEQRLKQEFENLQPGQPVLVVDLDGTVANFVAGIFKHFSHQGLNEIKSWDKVSSLALDIELALSYVEYQTQRHIFEASGGYGVLPSFEDGVALMQRARLQGAYIVVVTARPKSFKRIWYDTWLWLEHWNIVPDQLLILDDYDRINWIQDYLNLGHPVVLLEDNPSIVARIKGLCPVVVRAHGYNTNTEGLPNVIRTDNFGSVDLEALWTT